MIRFGNGNLRASIDSLRTTKMRNFWTMLGIIIGVASVISVVSIGQGIKQEISQQFHHYAKDVIIIRPARLSASGSQIVQGDTSLTGINVSGFLTQQDVTIVAATAGVDQSAPLAVVTGAAKGDNRYSGGLIIGTTADLPSLINQSMKNGFFLTIDDVGSNTAVLGSKAADALYNQSVPLGQPLTIRNRDFIVHGIFNDFDSTPLSTDADFNRAIFIPYDVAQAMSNGTAPTYEILARPTDPAAIQKVRDTLQKALDKAHGGSGAVSVTVANKNVGDNNAILDLLTKLIAGVAAISLLVGGIGIMNVMLVSVAERMHEIGIRKAIGATNRQILNQFMLEATLLSLTGGIIGIILAGLINVTIRLTTDLKPVADWRVVAIAVGVSLFVGILFGTLPALKAARKDPIDALRSE